MYARCRECGTSWNISIYAKIPKEGYICPWCRSGKKKKIDGRNEIKNEKVKFRTKKRNRKEKRNEKN